MLLSAFRLFEPRLKNSAEKEDLPSPRFPITSIIAGVEKPGGKGKEDVWGGGGDSSIIKAKIPSFGQQLSGHEF